MKTLKTLLMAIIFSAALPAQAHYLWIEQANGQTKLYFGEYENALHEETGGRLDSIAAPVAMSNVADAKPVLLSIKRMDDYLSVEGAKTSPVIAQELTMKVKDLTKHNMGIVKPMYYAKIGNGAAQGISNLDLDIQALGNNKVRINLHGKPLVKAKLKIYAPNQWMQELDANETGEVTFVMPWNGVYVLEVAYIEPVKGEYQNEKYDGVRHVSTLTVIK